MAMAGPTQTPEQTARARRNRNLVLAGALLFAVVLFYIMTIVRLGGSVGHG
jgi:hypothetical protein